MEFGRWIVVFLLNALIFLAWFGLLNRQTYDVSTRFLMAFVLSTAQILSSIFFLGLPWAKLTAPNLILVNVGLSSALLVLAATRGELLSSVRDLGKAVRGIFATINSGTAVLKILAVLVAATILWTVFVGILYPPIEWDSLMYHLPAVGHYIQQGSITDPPLPMGVVGPRKIDASLWVNSFPKNTELLFLWSAIIPGNDILVDLVELLFGLAGIVAVYALAMRMGVERKWAIVAGLLFFLTPVVIAQSRSSYIDLSNSALILVALALLYPGSRERRWGEVFAAGIAVGVVVGSKWSGLMFLPVLWAMMVGQRLYWNLRDRLPRLTKAARESALFLIPSLFLGAYWYVKNWYLYGNPFWPFRISLLGKEIFRGITTQQTVLGWTFPEQFQRLNMVQRLWVSWREIGITDYVHDVRPGGLGPFWFILGLPAIFYVLRWIIKRGDWAQALIFIAAGVMLVLHPDNWWTRFTMFIAGLGAIAFAMLRSAERRSEVTRLIDLVLITTVVYSTLAGVAVNYYQPAKIATLLKKPPSLRTSASERPEIISQAYDYVVQATVDKPANIAFGSGLDFTYPLWGSRLRNRVYYLEPDNLSSWIGKLREKRIKYVFIINNSAEQRLVSRSSLFSRAYFDRKWGYAVYVFHG